MDRRSFIKRTAATGTMGFIASTIAGRKVLAGIIDKEADISVIKGSDVFGNTKKAVELLGGMERFVPAGSKVGLLINSGFDIKGAYVHPDISLSILEMCIDAGAQDVLSLQVVEDSYWKRSERYDKLSGLFDKLSQVETNTFPAEYNDEDWMLIPAIEGAKSLQEVEVIKALKEVDILINVFIAKHHASTLYTGALKNSMGFCTRKTDVFYHLGSGERNDPEFLAQCIADINLLRQPDLIIGDATEFIISNGPQGPGEIKQMDRVFAGTNLVAMDALGASYNDFAPDEILTIIKAEQMGLGSYDLSELNVIEIS
ncbi:MAG: DUF362 domain-containing protein [Bacteroidetes bacterium]|nr:DUF362 domain-containing protein [Bacteroidota bacterium]